MGVPRILIVEDDAIVAKHLSLSVQSLGYEIAAVTNSGESAIQKCEETIPDLVLMDIMLQGELDGIEAAGQIRSRQDIPVIYVTAYSDSSVLERAKVTEPLGYVTKPVSKEALHCAIEIALSKKAFERALQEAQERLELALHGADLALWDYNLQTGEAFSNQRRAEMLGYSADEIEPHISSWGGLFHPDDVERILETYNAHAKGETPFYECENRLRCKSGEYIWVQARGKIVERDAAGRPLRMTGTSLDITDRKRAEEALRETQERLDLALNGADLALWDHNLQTGEAFNNQRGAEMLGYSLNEVGRHISSWGSRVHPEDVERIVKAYKAHLKGETSTYECEHRLRHKSGEYIWVLARGKIVERDAAGRPLRMTGTSLDITDRKRAEQAIEESEARYRFLADNALDIICQMSPEGVILYISPAVERTLGYDATKDVVGHAFYEFCHPDDLEILKEKHRKLLANPTDKIVRCRVRKKDGMYVWYETTAGVVRDSQTNHVREIVTVSRDVTRQKILEEELEHFSEQLELRVLERTAELRKTNAFLHDIMSSLTHPFYVIDAKDYTIEIANRAAGLLDITVGGKCYAATHGRTSPCSGPDHPCPLMEVKKTGTPQIIEHVHYDHEGNPRNVNVYAYPIKSAGGDVLQVIEYTLDITERKRAEEELMENERTFRSLFESATDLIHLLDKDGAILRTNPATLSLLGYSEDEMAGRAISDFFTPSSQRSFAQLFPLFLKEGHYRSEMQLVRKDGSVIGVDCSAAVISGKQGNAVGAVVFQRDATERKKSEKERESLREQLFQAQKMEAVGTLAGGIAHDFNNLLQIVLGYSDLLVMGKGKESPDLRNLDRIRKAAKDARHLVKGLLTFSRQAPSEIRPVDLNQQLKDVKSILERMIPKMIEIEVILADDLTAVNADPIQVEQVLINLAVNAHHAMPQGGKLTIEARNVTLDEDYCRTRVEAKPGVYVMLKISDTGHGMENGILNRIFEPFFTTKEVGVGTGLGLSIVYGIVKTHHGHITCSSEPGLGTTFSIYLPAVPGESNLDMAMTTGEMPAFGTETVLLVDDEEPIRNVVAQILTPRGYKVFTTEDGNEALEIYRKRKGDIDLVILDLNMPGRGGTEVLDAILEIDPKARVLIASGYSVNESTRKFLEFRASGFIGKPFDAGDLLRVVRKVLDEPGSRGSPVSGSGTASARSAEGEGTPATATPPLADASSEHETSDIEELPWRLKILAIDDREPYLRMLEAGLAQFGQTPITASSGIEGLQVFQETAVDLVVCDLGMPELDGWEVAKRIQGICREKEIPKTPFLLLTGQADMEDIDQKAREKMADCGVDAIVGKPIDIPNLLEVIKRLMKKSYGSKE